MTRTNQHWHVRADAQLHGPALLLRVQSVGPLQCPRSDTLVQDADSWRWSPHNHTHRQHHADDGIMMPTMAACRT